MIAPLRAGGKRTAAHTSTPLAALLELLSKGLDEHFDEEEAVILRSSNA